MSVSNDKKLLFRSLSRWLPDAAWRWGFIVRMMQNRVRQCKPEACFVRGAYLIKMMVGLSSRIGQPM